MTVYEKENDELYNNFLNDYFYKGFKNGEKSLELELIISPKCNLGCKYCYLHKYYNTSFPNHLFDEKRTINNLHKILAWVEKNEFKVNLDIFSGELFAQNIGYKVMDIIYEWCKTTPIKPMSITIPTNFTFILSDKYTEKVEMYLKNFNELNIPLYLSASFDGKYCEDNRPYIKDLDIKFDHTRNDEYYDKAFKFSKKWNTGFHPMVYSKNIEKWKDNFMWFQEQFEKHNIHWKHLYLLQVRNVEWTDYQLKEFYDFIYFLCEFAYNKIESNDDFIEFILNDRGFNILSEPFTHTSKGLPCAIQNELTIKVADMKNFPCHRLLYPDFEIGEFINDDENVLKFKTKNASLGLTIYGMESSTQPFCKNCNINKLCIGGCLGAQYEKNNSMFIPLQTVCKLNFNLALAIVKFFKDHNLLNRMYDRLSNNEKIYQLKYIEGMLND